MTNIHIQKKSLFSLFTLIITFMISACSNNLLTYFNHSPVNQINGNIYSHSIDIPENATITLSVTSIAQNENNAKSNIDYSFRTQSAGRSVTFAINLPAELRSKQHTLGMSARIEKNGELIMMSNTLSSIPENLSGTILLPVITVQQ
ncbi:TPA: YbaY family lipoprotein [Providencia rettgeri]